MLERERGKQMDGWTNGDTKERGDGEAEDLSVQICIAT